MEIDYRNVWMKENATAKRDAFALWAELGVLPASADANTRGSQLCIAAYEGEKLAALSTAYFEVLPRLSERFAFVRVLVGPDRRNEGVVNRLAIESYGVLEAWAEAHPEERVAGTAAIIVAPGALKGGYTKTGWVLVGYTDDDRPIAVRWFPHFRFEVAKPPRAMERMRG